MLFPNAWFVVATIAIGAVAIVPLWWALVDAARRPRADIQRLGLPRVALIVLILLLGPVGGVAYLAYAHVRLRESAGAHVGT
jgi:hypothetical protein